MTIHRGRSPSAEGSAREARAARAVRVAAASLLASAVAVAPGVAAAESGEAVVASIERSPVPVVPGSPAPPLASPGAPASAGSTVDVLVAQVEQLVAANAELTRTVAALTAERERLRAGLTAIAALSGPMEADRRLLLELRKDLPEARPDAETHLARVRELAQASDPVRLGPLALRVMQAAPAYLDWRDMDFPTAAAAQEAYSSSGASAFDTTWATFTDAALLTVSARFDAVLALVDRATR